MIIKEIEVKNFKFHHNLKFELVNKNCLIYGENGSGKSSIYEALYSNFYYYKNKDIVNGQLKIRDTFLHRDYSGKDLDVNILFDDNSSLNRKNEDLVNSEILNPDVNIPNIYFANEKVLRNIIDINFYDVIVNNLTKHVPILLLIEKNYKVIKKVLKDLKDGEELDEKIIKIRELADNECKSNIESLIPIIEINKILKKDLTCDFQVEFLFENSKIDLDKNFHNPFIAIKIKGVNDRNDFINHFNEAKLKLISIAIYFALIKRHETLNELKLLVLDDFLTSLDMANRKRIVNFIITTFERYQIIILTHNIQFYNMTRNLLKITKKEENWDIRNIFLSNTNGSNIIKKGDTYIDTAIEYLNEYKLEESGNFLRKEFEYIINRFEQILLIGRVEEMASILEIIKTQDFIIPYPKDNLKSLLINLENILENPETNSDNKIIIIKSHLKSVSDNKFKDKKLKFFQQVIHKTDLYKSILMNPASHNDGEKELYITEFERSIELLKILNKILNKLEQ